MHALSQVTLMIKPGEYDGSVFGCDHLLEPRWRLGRVDEEAWFGRLDVDRLAAFSARKQSLPERCRGCRGLSLCYGGCPRHRPHRGDTPEPSVLCGGYRMFYAQARVAGGLPPPQRAAPDTRRRRPGLRAASRAAGDVPAIGGPHRWRRAPRRRPQRAVPLRVGPEVQALPRPRGDTIVMNKRHNDTRLGDRYRRRRGARQTVGGPPLLRNRHHETAAVHRC